MSLGRASFAIAFCCLLGACTSGPKRSPLPAASLPASKTEAPKILPPRSLSDEQRRLLASALRPALPGKVEIVFERGNDEAANFASQLTTALLLGGQLAELHAAPNLPRPTVPGVGLRMQLPSGPPPAHADAILDALNKAHIPWENAISTGGPTGVLIIQVESR
jgi:hypothetical protein